MGRVADFSASWLIASVESLGERTSDGLQPTSDGLRLQPTSDHS